MNVASQALVDQVLRVSKQLPDVTSRYEYLEKIRATYPEVWSASPELRVRHAEVEELLRFVPKNEAGLKAKALRDLEIIDHVVHLGPGPQAQSLASLDEREPELALRIRRVLQDRAARPAVVNEVMDTWEAWPNPVGDTARFRR